MLHIVLIRPGATDYTRNGRIQGSLDIPLAPEGVDEAKHLAAGLKSYSLARIYACEGEPAEQTATLIGQELGVKVKVLDHLRNLDFGLWQGMLMDEVKRKQPRVYRQWQDHPDSICPPDGETLAEARARVRQALTRLARKHRRETVGLVAPEPLATLVVGVVEAKEQTGLWRAAEEHGTWEVLSVDEETLVHEST